MIDLRRIDDDTYVNVGDGNITTVTTMAGVTNPPWTRISFIGGSVSVPLTVAGTVKVLESERGVVKSWGGETVRG